GRGGEGRGLRFPNARGAGLLKPGCELAQRVAIEVILAQGYPVIDQGTHSAPRTAQALNRAHPRNAAGEIGDIRTHDIVSWLKTSIAEDKRDALSLGSGGGIWFTETTADNVGQVTSTGASLQAERTRASEAPTAGSLRARAADMLDGRLPVAGSRAAT